MRDFLKGTLKVLSWVLVLALLAGGILYTFFVTVLEVGHNGMAPTLLLGDRVLVWNTQELRLGDIALCRHPNDGTRYVMGRVVGRPGHRVTFERGQLTIDGESPDIDLRGTVRFEDAESDRTTTMRFGVEQLLDHDHGVFWIDGATPRMSRPHDVRSGLFVIGDNRTHRGEDSRDFGEIVPSTCVGKVFMRLTAAPSPPEIEHRAFALVE